MMMLAFTPLYDPLPALFPGMDDYWLWLVIPLVVAISVVYKGTRVGELGKLPRETVVMTVQIVMVMAVTAVVLGGMYWAAVRVL